LTYKQTFWLDDDFISLRLNFVFVSHWWSELHSLQYPSGPVEVDTNSRNRRFNGYTQLGSAPEFPRGPALSEACFRAEFLRISSSSFSFLFVLFCFLCFALFFEEPITAAP
jgi:hypothetical protein